MSKKPMLLKVAIFTCVLTLILVACSPAAPVDVSEPDSPQATSHGGEIGGYIEFVEALRAAGAEVTPSGEVEQPFFEVKGQIIQVDGQEIQVFEFADQASREAASDLISPDGSSIGTSMVTWIEEPHFRAKGELIVLYVGSDGDTINTLNQVLGEQITN